MEDGLVRSYRDLRVWMEGMDLAQMCYEATKAFPREEVYGMTSQIRRAAAAIPAKVGKMLRSLIRSIQKKQGVGKNTIPDSRPSDSRDFE